VSKPRLLLTEPDAYQPDEIRLLRTAFEVKAIKLKSVKELEIAVEEFQPEILLVGIGLRVSAELLKLAPSIHTVASPSTGTDHIDREGLDLCGIRTMSLSNPEVLSQVSSTAELAWALLLELSRRLMRAVTDVRRGSWIRENHQGRQLQGSTLGVVGHGRLGGYVARYGHAFGMKVLICDPRPVGDTSFGEVVPLADLFSRSDAVSIHVPLTNSTRCLIDDTTIGSAKSGLLLVNTSRGEIVDEVAVAGAVRSGKLGGYATDVIGSDSTWAGVVQDNPITKLMDEGYNVVVTPHIGGYTSEAVRFTRRLIIDELLTNSSPKKAQ